MDKTDFKVNGSPIRVVVIAGAVYLITPALQGHVIHKHDGTTYRVTMGRCTCPGFRHRWKCKHLEMVK